MTSPSGRARVTAKVGVDLPWHQRMLRIPRGATRAAALGLWTAANCYSRREELDGFCPLEAVESYVSDEVVTWLVEVGLFTHEEKHGAHGVRILRYDEFNETKADIERRLRADRQRKKGSKPPRGFQQESERNPNGIRKESDRTPGIGNGEGSGSDLGGGAGEGHGANERDSGVFGMEGAAWSGGISDATGRPCTQPPWYTVRDHLAPAKRHANGLQGEALLKWYRAKAKKFADSVDPKFGGYTPARFRTWLDGGEKYEAGNGASVVRDPPVKLPAEVDPNNPEYWRIAAEKAAIENKKAGGKGSG